jgi:hypothetical protein
MLTCLDGPLATREIKFNWLEEAGIERSARQVKLVFEVWGLYVTEVEEVLE